MRILIDILHPAHVHFFRNFAREMESRGHAVLFTARAKDGSIELLKSYDWDYHLLSRQLRGTLGLARELFARTRRLIRVAQEWQPDVMTGIMGPSIALAGRRLRVPAVVFYDTESAWQTNWFVYPLAHSVCTPDCYEGRVRGNHVRYAGYHELAYLHPARFALDATRLAAFGVTPGERYTVVRFVSWEAIHDITEKAIPLAHKRRLVDRLRRYGRVLISSEGPMPEDLEAFRVKGPFHDIHQLIGHAALLVGDSGTMTSEAAVLGVPTVYIARRGLGYINEQEMRYGLVRRFGPARFEDALANVGAIMSRPSTDFERGRDRMLEEKIDVTSWMIQYFQDLDA
jgi:uncharacterized protein